MLELLHLPPEPFAVLIPVVSYSCGAVLRVSVILLGHFECSTQVSPIEYR
jgi:hypothetical protein